MSAEPRFFKSLYFGEASAEAEAEKWPLYFVNSFLDHSGVAKRICEGDAYLLIGPKGAGKSSYVEYLRLQAPEASQFFIRREDLGELRGALKTDLSLSESGAELTELAWSTWIWTHLFDSLMADNGASPQLDPETVSLHAELRMAGVATGDFRTVLREIRRKQHKFAVPRIYEFTSASGHETRVNIGQLRDLLADIVCKARTSSTHVLALDGLDSAEIGTDSYWKQLAALLRASTRAHQQLRSAESRVRICLLCRSDVFLKIPIPDSNKIRHAWGVELKWDYGLETPKDSILWEMLEKKVAARGASTGDLLETYFPSYMEVGKRTRPRRIPMPRYLLELTRSTPRDMVMLMRYIQDELNPQQGLDIDRIRAGANSYCKYYFTGEVINELIGMVDASIAQGVISAMTRLPARRFSREDFLDLFSNQDGPSALEADTILRQLYLVGAIANYKPSGGGEEYVKFYHRRSHAELDLRGPFLLHNALTYGLNLPWTPSK
ncbi:P-loop ATPase, Sll1717 family [Phytohabitans houttuyneae]|uniref:P-loop ATPase, Sll1717 family n=1 Tax=Phytohabitans houttuyneae TaxID=1076126 RepID=UPI0031EA3A5F